MWGALEWEVTPLQTFAGRATQERNIIRELKKERCPKGDAVLTASLFVSVRI
jgi:hypothetical protein